MVSQSLKTLDVELGIREGELEKPKWVTRFKNTNLVKWFSLQVKLIPERFIHFPFIFICSLLYSATYPSTLPTTHSFIISLVTTFVVRYLFYPINNQLQGSQYN